MQVEEVEYELLFEGALPLQYARIRRVQDISRGYDRYDLGALEVCYMENAPLN